MNPKSNERIGEFSEDISMAIKQEKKINQDIYKEGNILTINIGQIIETHLLSSEL